jgi:lipoyl(octanoyl) transferase
MFSFLYLGRVDYPTALELQKKLANLRHEERIGNTLLLLEHSPVLTLGRNSQRENILASDELLARRGVSVYETNRGGDVTYHGPGQLVGYPIFDLRSLRSASGGRLSVVDYLRVIEEALIRTCAFYGILTSRSVGRTGVWTLPGGTIPEKKIAAIGVHISRGITSHGFALNLTTDLRDFDLIVPCGIADRAVTSIEQEIASQREVPSLEQLSHQVTRQLGVVLDEQVLAVGSLEELMRPSGSEGASIRTAIAPLKDAAAPVSNSIPEDTPLRIPKELRGLKGERESFLA